MRSEVCCPWSRQTIVDGDLVDTYGGDYTFQYVYYCPDCNRMFSEHTGAKPSFEEIYASDDEFQDYLSQLHDQQSE